MDIPQPPQDAEQRTVIERLAQFVARNGSEFERLTREKQRNNPLFGFLFGGELYNYYQYCVSSERAMLAQQQQPPQGFMNMNRPPSHPPGSMGMGPLYPGTPQQGWQQSVPGPMMGSIPPHVQIQQMQHQIEEIQEAINRSEHNLSAQYDSMNIRKQRETEQLHFDSVRRRMQLISAKLSIRTDQLDQAVQPVIDACTKENVSAAKSWILEHVVIYPEGLDLLSLYCFDKASTILPMHQYIWQLHLVYLANDLLHHSVRKQAESLRLTIQRIISPLFAMAMSLASSEEEQEKLQRLAQLWKQNAYLDSGVIARLETTSLDSAKAAFLSEVLGSEFVSVAADCERRCLEQFRHLEAQHVDFVGHSQRQMEGLQQRIQSIAAAAPPPAPPPHFGLPPPNWQPPLGQPPPLFHQSGPHMPVGPMDYHLPPSLPAPLLGPQPPPPPMLPYYELPAGLMVSLVNLEDSGYRKSIDPDLVRLPPPCPPTERLLQAVEAFYGPPSHENPRDADGWERLGLYEYYQMKEKARKEARLSAKVGNNQRSRSPVPRSSRSSSSGRSSGSPSSLRT